MDALFILGAISGLKKNNRRETNGQEDSKPKLEHHIMSQCRPQSTFPACSCHAIDQEGGASLGFPGTTT